MKRIIFFGILILATGCAKTKLPKEIAQEVAIPVAVVEVKQETLTNALRVHGEIKASDSVAIYSKVNGKLKEYTVKKGSTVQKGDLIAYIDRDEVGYQYNQAPVYSPISGMVSALSNDQGSTVQTTNPIGHIINIDSVKAVFSLPERYRGSVHLGQKIEVTVDSLAGKAFVADVCGINPLIDPTEHAFKIDVFIENPKHALIPGMFAAGDLALATYKESVLLPEESILPIHGEWFIYTIASDQAVLKKVELGLRKAGRVQVLSGVEPGDLVIVGGNHKVSDGQKVRVQL